MLYVVLQSNIQHIIIIATTHFSLTFFSLFSVYATLYQQSLHSYYYVVVSTLITSFQSIMYQKSQAGQAGFQSRKTSCLSKRDKSSAGESLLVSWLVKTPNHTYTHTIESCYDIIYFCD